MMVVFIIFGFNFATFVHPDNSPYFKNKALQWIEDRLPILAFFHHHIFSYKTAKNLSYAWNFGSIGLLVLATQIITGIFLAMHYAPNVQVAFDSVEHIMRDVNYGWLIRYAHAVGASMFFFVIYIHIARGLFYGSYKAPRELLWWIGIVIFFLMMGAGFMGYILPWGQMSFWGATVITGMTSAVPIVGEGVMNWLLGGFSVDNATLNRFFVFHFLLPFVICAFVALHLIALHAKGSSNPSGIEVKGDKDQIPLHPYYTIKDFFGFGVFLFVFAYFIFFNPNYLGHPDNYIPADPLVTPNHIVPEWYFLVFYTMLRSIPNKLGGIIVMIGAIAVWFLLPMLDKHPVRSGHYRPWFKKFYFLLICDFIFLLYLGQQQPDGIYLIMGRLATAYYFSYFFIILPILSKFEKPLVQPSSVHEHYVQRKKLSFWSRLFKFNRG